MENNKKDVIITQTNIRTESSKIDFIKELNDLKNNKIVQLAVTSIMGLIKRRKNEDKSR